MAAAGVKVRQGDIKCLASGHIARMAVNGLRDGWDNDAPLSNRMQQAEGRLVELARVLGHGLHATPCLETLTKERS